MFSCTLNFKVIGKYSFCSLNSQIYYHNCNLKEEGFKILDYVQTTILNFIDRYDDKQNVKLSFAKLIDVQSLYLNSDNDYLNTDESISYLASLENGYVEFRELLSLG